MQNLRAKIFIIFLLLCVPGFAREAKIGVVYNSNITSHMEIAEVFSKKISKYGYEFFLAPYDVEPEKLLNKIRDENCSNIYIIGNGALNAVRESNLPGIYFLIQYPYKYGLINSDGTPATNLYGISLETPVELQFKMLQAMMPAKKNIGIVYNPENTMKSVKNIKDAAVKFGYTIIDCPVKKEDEVLPAYESIKRKINIILTVLDKTVISPANVVHISYYSLHNKIPLIGLNPKMTQSGALISFNIDYNAVAEQSAEMMNSLISGTIDQKKGISYPEKISYSINKKIAVIMNVDIPEDILNNAENVY